LADGAAAAVGDGCSVEQRLERIRERIAPFRVQPASELALGRGVHAGATGGLFTYEESDGLWPR
jgi:hypothetical protein